MRKVQGMGRVGAVLAVVGLLSGCWLQVGHGPEHANFNPDETKLTTANIARLDDKWTGYPGGNILSEPIVSGGRVYVSRVIRYRPDGTSPIYERAGVSALDAATGRTVWSEYISPDMEDVEPDQVVFIDDELWVSYDGSNYDGTCAGALIRLDAMTGKALGTEFSGRASAVVSFGDKVAWSGQRLEPAGSCESTATPELVVRDQATRATLWTAPAPAVGLPAVIGGKVLVAGTAYPATGCGASTCPALWSADVTEPVVAQAGSPRGHIFLTVGTGNGAYDDSVVAIDPDTGEVLWTLPTAVGGILNGRVAVAGDFVYAVSGDGWSEVQVYPIDGCGSPTCPSRWQGDLPGGYDGIIGGPVVAGGVVYVATELRVMAFPAAGCGASQCAPLTWLNVEGGPVSVSDGMVFVSTRPYVVVPRVQAFAPAP